eukprot:6203731-Pleurochrysis_carterae.AAC.3
MRNCSHEESCTITVAEAAGAAHCANLRFFQVEPPMRRLLKYPARSGILTLTLSAKSVTFFAAVSWMRQTARHEGSCAQRVLSSAACVHDSMALKLLDGCCCHWRCQQIKCFAQASDSSVYVRESRVHVTFICQEKTLCAFVWPWGVTARGNLAIT